MIYTVTFNPSLDYAVNVESLKTGKINRCNTELILPGGKGINVSVVLNNLGIENIALGFVAGFTGDKIKSDLNDMGCRTDFITLENGMSRINVKIKSDEETEINGNGPEIRNKDIEKLFEQFKKLDNGDILVISGSIPKTLPQNIYEKILEQIQVKNIRTVVDATNDLLKNVLKYKPFLIKPNNHELGEMFGKTINTDDEIIECGKKLQAMGAKNVLISMAKDGAILIGEDGYTYKSNAPKGKVINSVGAGDSMVAGFLAGYMQSGNLKKAFNMGVAAGSASAFSKFLATKQEVLDLVSAL